jgi:8-amino-7-oxononanoate synthase
VVLADGFCPGCGEAAPARAYLFAVRRFGGLLVLDDTQALGILGASPAPAQPYGRGGGGSLRWHGLRAADVLIAGSLAKAFGAPLAALAGPRALVRRFDDGSETRVHCSPPSSAALAAAAHALDVNQLHGDALRLRLARLVRRFRCTLHGAGIATVGGGFPVQTLALPPAVDVPAVHERLLKAGVRAVLHRARGRGQTQLSFLVTAAHRAEEVDAAASAVARVLRDVPARPIRLRGAS